MRSLAEKIEAAKRCCGKVKDYIADIKRELNGECFNPEWEVLVVKKDEETGKFIGKRVSCALCSE